MYFDDDDDKNRRNVNLGNKTISNKDDFLKKIELQQKMEMQKQRTEKSNKIIKSFFKRHFQTSCVFKHSNLINNLKSVLALLNSGKLDKEKNQQIAFKTLEKTILEINYFLSCKMIPIKTLNELCVIIAEILTYIQYQNISLLFNRNDTNNYLKLFILLIKIGTYQIYYYIKQDYIINDKEFLFSILINLFNFFPQTIREQIIKYLSNNISYIFILNSILVNIYKIININNIELLLILSNQICIQITHKRRNYYKNNNNFHHKIIDEYFESFLKLNLKEEYLDISKKSFKMNLFDLLFNLQNEYQNNLFFLKLNDYQIMQLFSKILSRLNDLNEYYCINSSLFLFFIQLLNKLNSNQELNKMKRTELLKGVNDLLEILFMKMDENTPVLYIIKLIYESSKFIENLYLSNFEKTNYQNILEHIVNKIALKYQTNLSNKIFIYSIELLKEKFPKLKNNSNKLSFIKKEDSQNLIFQNEKLFEIISYFVINHINYKSNYFFVEFKTTKNIYENLPFNYLYLTYLSKYLIQLFTELILRTNVDEIDQLNQNIIIKCLRRLYDLDGEINFTYHREQFWNNMELVSKITGKNKKYLIEKMKIMPFIFPLKIRLDLCTHEFEQRKMEYFSAIHHNDFNDFFGEDPDNPNDTVIYLQIPRESIFETTFSIYFQNLLNPYKRWIISFVDKFGHKEEGADAGGLFKEFLYKISEECFGTKINLFTESSTGYLLPNKDSCKISNKHLEMFEFLGFIVGKGILEDIKLYPNLSPIFCNNILEVENAFTDLKEYDPELYKNLVSLKQYEGDVENDLGLTFCISEQDSQYGHIKNVNLIENGDKINVTNSNRLLYIKKMTEYKLYYQFKDQCYNFRMGMSKVIDMDLLKVFTGDELRQLIYGFDKDAFDLDDMRNNIKYLAWNLNDPNDVQCIKNFYQILSEFDDKEKEKFLFFCTSLKRLPIGGFSKLNPPFTLAKASIQVPTSSTCANILKLPPLPYQKMKDLLKYVINADAGFYYA